ncbi:MAG: DUF5946 family protein [Bacteroidota bacterium]
MNNDEAFHQLSYYTFAQPRAYFIHQHVVDAYAVQEADETTKPIKIVFGLVGLYLYLEKGFSGKEVQLFHMKMAKRKIEWPKIVLPEERDEITVLDVLATPDAEKDKKIRLWCEKVWEAFAENRKVIIDLVNHYLKT